MNMQTPLMQQYMSIKKNYTDCLLLFRLGDFYELFFEDAKIAAKILNIVLTKRKEKIQDIPMAGIPAHTCDHYISKLVKNGYKIALCEQINLNNNDKIINREVIRIITSGTLTEDNLLEANRNNYLMSIFEYNLKISAAILDLSTNEFSVEDIEKENFNQFLEKFDPNEILIPQKLIYLFRDFPEIKNKITIINEVAKFHANDIIMEFYTNQNNELLDTFSIENKITIANILEYIKYTQKKSSCNIKFPIKIIQEEKLLINKFTLQNLEITKTLQNQTKGSLLWFLDNTKTSQGARKLYKTLTNPITNISKLNKRYEKIEYFLNKKDELNQIYKYLEQTPDFERLISKIKLNRTNPQEIKTLSMGIINIINLSKFLGNNIPNNIEVANQTIAAIKEEITSEEFIKQGYDKDLDELKFFNENIEQELKDLEENYKNYTKLTNLRIKNTPLGFLVEVNNQNTNKLDYSFKLKQNLKTASRYSTQDLEELNYKYTNCKDQIKTKEKEIFDKLCNEIIYISEDIYCYNAYSAEIDLYSNLAAIAIEYSHSKPILTNDKTLKIQDGENPILQKIFKIEGKALVSNDCDLTKPIMFLTGPNMAGKSTFLRQQALICYMAQCGIFIPAKSGKIGIIDKIFCRLSTNDNILTGTSTFMMEMIEISLTINQASEKSLLILDEIGRGTCAEEGMAISKAVLEYLLDKLQTRTLLSTHYLQIGKIEHPQLQKKMMQIYENPMHFTYKLINGVSKKSYALEIAKLAGMPEEIIINAENLLKKQ